MDIEVLLKGVGSGVINDLCKNCGYKNFKGCSDGHVASRLWRHSWKIFLLE